MPQLFSAQPLQKLLQYWEDTNLSGEFNFLLDQMIKKEGKTAQNKKTTAMIGSELNGIGLLARSIPKYLNLRKILEGHPLTHPTNFLPRIPTYFRSIFGDDRQLFMDHLFVESPVRISEFLLKWNETKRACIVEDSIPMPIIDLRKENWLKRMPYHSFFLEIKSPLVFSDPEGREWSIKDMLVYDDGEYLRVLAWPEEIEKFMLTPETRKKIKGALSILQKSKPVMPQLVDYAGVVNDWFMNSLIIQKSTGQFKEVRKLGEVSHYDIYDDSLFLEDEGKSAPLYLKTRVLIETVNGFCKLMTTLPPKPSMTVINSNTQDPHPSPPRQWFELPLQTVEYFHTEKENEVIVIKHGSSSEKSPHVRRGHTRRYVRKDGTIHNIWIDEVTVRADKLVTQQLQGGALKVE